MSSASTPSTRPLDSKVPLAAGACAGLGATGGRARGSQSDRLLHPAARGTGAFRSHDRPETIEEPNS